MEIEIKKERETPLLSRRRVTAMVKFEGATPSRQKIRESIAKKTGSTEELTVVKHIYPRFGSEGAKVIAHIYSKEEDKNRVEREYLLKKHKSVVETVSADEGAAAGAADIAKETKEESKPTAEEKSEENEPSETAEKTEKSEGD
jgi:ribosomal protein S24E